MGGNRYGFQDMAYITELMNEGWNFFYTKAVPHSVDGFTSCDKKTVWFNTFDILLHELGHVINDCPNWIADSGAIIDLI